MILTAVSTVEPTISAISWQDPLQALFQSPLQTACEQHSKGIGVGEKVVQNFVLAKKTQFDHSLLVDLNHVNFDSNVFFGKTILLSSECFDKLNSE